MSTRRKTIDRINPDETERNNATYWMAVWQRATKSRNEKRAWLAAARLHDLGWKLEKRKAVQNGTR